MSSQSQPSDLCTPLSGNAGLRGGGYLPRYTRSEGTNARRNCLASTDGGVRSGVEEGTDRRLSDPVRSLPNGRFRLNRQAAPTALVRPPSISHDNGVTTKSSRLRSCALLRGHRGCSRKRNLDAQRRAEGSLCLDRHMASAPRPMANRGSRGRFRADKGIAGRRNCADPCVHT
jgi:hypothetical protein